jgi:hypothetical protein
MSTLLNIRLEKVATRYVDRMDRIYDSRKLKGAIWMFLVFAVCFFGKVIFHIINR